MATPTEHRHDVVVVGGRSAGASVARLLAAQGHDVAVLERATFPSDTLSTHAIARGGVVQLARWGLLGKVLATGAPAVRQVTFRTGGSERTLPVKDRAGVDHLLAPRRTALDALLADEAAAAGARLVPGTRVTGLLRDSCGRVCGVTARGRDGRDLTFRARHVVGADGLRSATARAIGARTLRSFAADVSTWYAYVAEVPWRGFEFHIGPGSFAGAFPTNDGQACVWLCRPTALSEPVRAAGARRTAALVDALAEAAPDLAERVRRGRVASSVRGAAGLPNHLRAAHGPGWALVGDAGYHRDPITGHGITDAFRDAELLAEALDLALTGAAPEKEALDRYQSTRDAAVRETFALTRDLAAFPDPHRFVELQVELSEALDREARMLASRPVPAGLPAVTAA